jgi:hypothetical protein
MTMAFPTLFPDGAGDFYQARLRKVDLGEYFKHLLRFRGGRFAQHKRFPRFAFNTLSTRSQLKVFVKQQHDAGQLTVADLRAMLAEGDQHIVNQMICYGANLRGTRTYWTARRHELMDFIQNKSNPPRLSLNLLSASYHMSSLRRRIGMCMMMFFWTRDDYWDHYMNYFPFLFTGVNLSFGTLIFRFVSLD